MKKRFLFVFTVLVLGLFCSGCEGDVTRAIRHDGFNVGGDFICDAFIGEAATESVYFFTGNHFITTNGRIYELSIGKTFANNANCKPADTSIQVLAIFDNRFVKAVDGRYYSLVNQNNGSGAYQEITDNDNSYAIYDLLLKPDDTIKVGTVDASNGVYYVLKNDGNVYDVTIRKDKTNSTPSILGQTVVYSQDDYGGPIIDFNYNGNSGATFVRTQTKAYHLNAINYAECSRYADVACDYRMMESASFAEYGDYILAYNGAMIITTYGKTFTVAS